MVMEYFGILYLISEDINHMSNVAAPHPQILANQLALFKQEGRLYPPYYYLPPAPQDFQTFLRPWHDRLSFAITTVKDQKGQ